MQHLCEKVAGIGQSIVDTSTHKQIHESLPRKERGKNR